MKKQPNILLVLMDDMGFSDAGCYGGEIETPVIDRLAANGLRFSQFYNAARCWPTRSAILTGYYAPQVSMDPPVREYRPPWQREIPHYLRSAGYRNYHSGKWHLFNTRDPQTQSAFDSSWGYHIEQSKHFFRGDDGRSVFSSTAITDHALACLDAHEAEHAGKPFFHYLCYTAPHFPVQAEPQDIAKYMDVYLEGWDVLRERRWRRQRAAGIVQCGLSSREPHVPAPYYHRHKEACDACFGPDEIAYALPWDSLTPSQQRFQATKMAIHAAMIDRTDRELGRVLDKLAAMHALEDTLVLFLSDNGASAEMMVRGDGHDPAAPPGSESTHLCLGPGWSTCANTPFRRHKIWVHEGGCATPLVACWPNGISARGELRHDVGHCIDFLPTLMDLAGVKPVDIPLPEGAPPLPGKSLVPAFAQDGSVQREHLYFHHEGNRALRVGDWKLVNESGVNQGMPDDPWALYDLSKDRCEMVNLANEMPQKCQELQTLWHQCEERYRASAASRVAGTQGW